MGGGSPDGETGGSVAACEGKAVAAPGRGTRPAVTGPRSLLPSDPGGFDSRTRSPRSASLDVLMGEGSRPSHGLGSTRGPTFFLISRRIDTLVVAFISPLGIAARRPSSPRPLHRGLCTVPFHHRQPFRSTLQHNQTPSARNSWSDFWSRMVATFFSSNLRHLQVAITPSPNQLTDSGRASQGLHFLQSHWKGCQLGFRCLAGL